MNHSNSSQKPQAQDNLLKNFNFDGNQNSINYSPQQTNIENQIVHSFPTNKQLPLNKNSPYQGLKRFNFRNKDYFYGRNELITELLYAVQQTNLILVVGASGSGKSSVVRAGLIPEFKNSLSGQKFYDFVFTPSTDPFDALYDCLRAEEKDYCFRQSEAEIALSSKADTLLKVINNLQQDGEHWLLFIDQFEELFTLCSDIELRQNFIDSIVQIANSGNERVKIVLAMRADFLEEFSFYKELGGIVNQSDNFHLVTDMQEDELRKAIELPAYKHGVTFEAELVTEIIQDIQGQKGYLPLLQYTLDLLWQTELRTNSFADKILKTKSYRALKGVRGALQERITNLYTNFNQNEQIATKQIFMNLVDIKESDSGSKTVGKRAYRSEFVGTTVKRILNRLIDNEKLLVSSNENLSPDNLSPGENKESATVEVAHEILLSSWDLLRGWIEEEKEAIILKNWLANETKRWLKICDQDETKAQDELLKGARLEQIADLNHKNAFKSVGGLNDNEAEFINLSLELRAKQEQEKELQRQKELKLTKEKLKATKNKNRLAVISAILLSALTTFSGYQQREATRQGVFALAQSSEALLSFDYKRLDALVTAVEAGKKYQEAHLKNPVLKQIVTGTLQQAVYEPRGNSYLSEVNILSGHSGDVSSVSLSPTKNLLVSAGSEDNTIKLWNLGGKEPQTLVGHQGAVNSVSFSPNGKVIASASSDGTVKLWDVAKPKEEPITLRHSKKAVNSVSFSPNGKVIASASGDGTVKFWDLYGKELDTLGYQEAVNSVSFSPDGQVIASASSDGTVKLWDLDREEPTTLTGHQEAVNSVSFSPDGQVIASASDDGTVKLWDLDGKELKSLNIKSRNPYNTAAKSVSFNPDGTLFTASWGTIQLWSIDGKLLQDINAHNDRVMEFSFSHDGKTIASASGDNTIKLWKLNSPNNPTLRRLSGHKDFVNAALFSPDGKTIASASDDGTVRLWDSTKPEKAPEILTENQGEVYSISFSRDGKILAWAGANGSIKLWDSTKLEKEPITLTENQGEIYSISFSRDGKILAWAGANGSIKLWDSTKPEKEPITLTENQDEVYSISFSPDGKGKLLASAGADGSIKLWDITKLKKEPITLTGHQGAVNSVIFSPDGKVIASGSDDNTIKLWSLNGQELKTLLGHRAEIRNINFSPDGKVIASGSDDNTIKLWSLDGQELRTFKGHGYNSESSSGAVNSVGFSPDGVALVSASEDNKLILWNLNLDKLLDYGCGRLQNYLKTNPSNENRRDLCN